MHRLSNPLLICWTATTKTLQTLPGVKHVTLRQLLALHLLLIQKYGGSNGVRDMGRLESVIAAQSQHIFGTELYPTVLLKAAALCRGIIGDHPFVDGNKRTAMLAALVILRENGYQITAKQGEIEDFAVKVAVDDLSVEQIADWLNRHHTYAPPYN